MTAPLRVGFIGCGTITQNGHLRALRAVPEVEVVALADPDAVHLHATGDRFGIARRHADATALLAADGVDAVAVCIPAAAHVDVALAALEAGKHLFLEKPIALSLADGDRLIAAARRSSLTVQMGFNLRWHRLVRAAREEIRSGGLGRIVAVRSAFTSGVRFHDDAPPWRRRRGTGGGELFESAVHHFDLWRFLLDTEIEEVFATSHSNDWDDETAAITARLANGTLASAVFSVATAGLSDLEFYGEKARLALSLIHFDGFELAPSAAPTWSLRSRLGGFVRALESLPRAVLRARHGGDFIGSYGFEWRHFADCVRRGVPAACTLDDGRHALQAVLAAVQAASHGRAVRVAGVSDASGNGPR